MGDGAKYVALWKLIMSNISSDSWSYIVPDTLRPRASLASVVNGVVVGTRSVEIGGGMKGLRGMGLGIRGDTIETRSGSLIRLVDDLGDSKRMLASRLRRRFGVWPDRRTDLDRAAQLLVEYDRQRLPCKLLKKGTMYGIHAVQMLTQTCACVHMVGIQRSYSGFPCGVTW